MSLTPRLDRAEKNFIINGNFDLWQRNTSLLLTSAGASDKNYLADRWSHTNFFASGSITVSRSVDVPSSLKDATYSMSTQITTAASVAHATNNYSLNAGVYRMEGYDAAKLHGKTVTLQFWVKSSLTGLYSVAVGSNFDTATPSYVSTYTVNAANTWEQKSLTLLIDNTVGSFAKDNTQGLFVGFGLAARVGSTRETSTLNQWGVANSAYVASTANRTDFISTVGATIRIAQVKLSIGSQVTDFSGRGETIGDELALCQRYFEKSYDLEVAPGTNLGAGYPMGGQGWVVSAIGSDDTLIGSSRPFLVIKRATPVVTTYSPAGLNLTGQAYYFRSLGSGGSGSFALASAYANTSMIGVTINQTINTGVECVICWTADAEL